MRLSKGGAIERLASAGRMPDREVCAAVLGTVEISMFFAIGGTIGDLKHESGKN
jgi:hypothetical protein